MEVSMTDVVMKSITDSLGKQVNKSDDLAKEWKSNISNLDTFIKGLSAWKRVIGYTACLLTIGAFLWKMGAIPNFLSNIISIVPAILPSGGIHPVKEISKEAMSNTLHTMMETHTFNDCSQYWYSHLRNNSMDITTFSKIIMILTLINRICIVNHAYISEAEYHESTISLLSPGSNIRHIIGTLC
jgi:hypothetical protein